MSKVKSNKNEFRCVICNELENEKSDFWIPLLIEDELNEMKVCTLCYADNIHAVAEFNADYYCLEAKRKPKKELKRKVLTSLRKLVRMRPGG